MTTRGVVYIHSAPPALCPHVEWAVGGVLGVRVHAGLDAAAGRARDRARRAVLAGRAGHRRPARLGAARLDAPALRGHRGAQRRRRGRALLVAPRRSGSSTRPSACTATSWSARTGCGRRWPAAGRDPAADARVERDRQACSARPGTTSSSRSATPATAPPSAGCTRSSSRAPRRPLIRRADRYGRCGREASSPRLPHDQA